MPIERPLSNRGYIRPGGTRYEVKTNDDWESVARAHGISAHHLIYFNCGTTDPPQVNWYLHHKVGCVRPTHDGKNWMFTTENPPLIIYLPPKDWKRPVFPHTDIGFPEQKPVPSGIWFGFGGQTGGHLAIAGKDTVEACLYSLETYQNRFWMNIDGWRVGPGLGASIGVIFVIATGVRTPHDLMNFKVSGGDFQFNMGGKWGDVAKGAKELNMVRKFAKGAMFIEKTIDIAKWEKLRNAILDIKALASINWSEKTVTVLPIPVPGFGAGLEISAYYGWGSVYVHGETLEGG